MKEAVEVEVCSQAHSPHQLFDELKPLLPGAASEILLRLKRSRAALDPPVVVAIVTGGLSMIGILITAIITAAGRQGIIKIKTRSGEEIEFPANTSPQKVQDLLAIHHSLDASRIELIKTSDS